MFHLLDLNLWVSESSNQRWSHEWCGSTFRFMWILCRQEELLFIVFMFRCFFSPVSRWSGRIAVSDGLEGPCFFFEQWEVDSMGNPRYLAEPKSEVDLGLLKWIWWSMHPKGYDYQVGWVNLMPFRKYRFFLFIFFLLWVLNIFVAPVNLLIARRPLQDRKRILPRSHRTVDERGNKMNGDKTTWLDSCEGKKHDIQFNCPSWV